MDVLQGRLYTVEQEIADLQSLLTIMRAIERDAVLRERLRTADLGFALHEVLALSGEARRRALSALEALVAPAPSPA